MQPHHKNGLGMRLAGNKLRGKKLQPRYAVIAQHDASLHCIVVLYTIATSIIPL